MPFPEDNVLKPSDLGSTVQPYDADTPIVTASQVEMEAGTETAVRAMSPLRIFQAITAKATALGVELISRKETSGGYAGLTLFKINFRNAADTFTSFLTNANTAARTYTFPDKDITVAGLSDITGTNSGVNTGDQTSIVGITGTIAQFNTAVTDADLATLGANTFTGGQILSDQQVSRAMLIDCGYTVYDKGSVASGTFTIDYTSGQVQTWTNTGAHTIATSNWPPTGNLGEILLIGTNLNSAAITWPSWTWIKPDGTTTTSIATYLAANGTRTALQTSGVDQILIWSRDAGTTVYARLI